MVCECVGEVAAVELEAEELIYFSIIRFGPIEDIWVLGWGVP